MPLASVYLRNSSSCKPARFLATAECMTAREKAPWLSPHAFCTASPMVVAPSLLAAATVASALEMSVTWSDHLLSQSAESETPKQAPRMLMSCFWRYLAQ